MKNKKSKIVAFMLLATMILTMNLLSIQVNAYELTDYDPECEHDYKFTYKIVEYISINSSSHRVEAVYYYQCSKCNINMAEIKIPTTKSHSISINYWHAGSRHYEEYSCGYCGFIQSMTSWACSGNPCIRPLKVNFTKN
jgi:hypothetical protein